MYNPQKYISKILTGLGKMIFYKYRFFLLNMRSKFSDKAAQHQVLILPDSIYMYFARRTYCHPVLRASNVSFNIFTSLATTRTHNKCLLRKLKV